LAVEVVDDETVASVARKVEVSLENTSVHIVDDVEEARYLDFQDAYACTPVEKGGSEVRLGPASFADEETLGVTLAHEAVHVRQLQEGATVSTQSLRGLEEEAYAAEGPALEKLRGFIE
jgi:hypothetical protein